MLVDVDSIAVRALRPIQLHRHQLDGTVGCVGLHALRACLVQRNRAFTVSRMPRQNRPRKSCCPVTSASNISRRENAQQRRPALPPELINGTIKKVDGKRCVFYDGYWIRYYDPPEDGLGPRKALIDSLTRRLFHHTEAGINTPGERLETARSAYESEQDPARKRVNAAMLAGALFNRATDIFNSVVDLAAKGVEISSDNELMRQCERYFEEALQLGKQVKHYSGHEGIDEMWGEPFKAFVLPTAAFYESRYLKIGQSMRDIDVVAEQMTKMASTYADFEPCLELVAEFSRAAKQECETMRRDPDSFQIWPRYVAAGEALLAFEPTRCNRDNDDIRRMIHEGKELLGYISGARVPMPKSTAEFISHCDRLRRRLERQSKV